MPVHHVLTRTIELLAGLWAAGGFVFLSYFGFRWDRVREGHLGRIVGHAVHASYAPPAQSEARAPENDANGSSASRPPSSSYEGRAARSRRIRSSSPVRFS